MAMGKRGRIQEFLDDNGHTNDSFKFLGMSYLVFLAMPVNALRAMGVTDKFICDHKQLVARTQRILETRHPQQREPIQQQQRQTLDDKRVLPQNVRVTARSISPDGVYHTPAVPVDTIFATRQAKLGDDCCGHSGRGTHEREHRPKAPPEPSQRQLRSDSRRDVRQLRSDVTRDERQPRFNVKPGGQSVSHYE